MAEVGTYYITIMPEMSKFTGAVNSALKGAGSTSGKTYSTSFMDIVKGSALGTALGNLASKAGGVIASGFGTGISRLDTIKNYPKVMQSLGYSTDDADRSIKTIMEHLDGLPTATQDMVTLTQAISDSTGDLDLATAAALGFNDMMLANGASAEEMTTAQGVLNRVLGKGSATTAQWQSLTSVMPAQLGMVAKSMLGAGASTEDLHAALEDGTISWNDFLQAIADLDKNGYIDEAGNKLGSFEEQARANSHGIGTAIDNIRNRVGAGWAEILDRVGQEEISGTIDKMSYGVKNAMYRVADAVGYIKDAIGKTKIAENLGKIFKGIGDAFARIDTGELKKFADAIVGLIDGALQWIVDHGDLVSSLLVGIGVAIGTVGTFLSMIKGAAILGFLKGTPGLIQAVWAALAANPFAAIIGVVSAATAAIVWFFTQTETGRGIIEGLKRDFANLVDTVKQNLEVASAQWQVFKQNIVNWNEAVRTAVLDKWNAIKSAVAYYTKDMINNAKSQWSNWSKSVATWNENIRKTILDKWNAVKTGIANTLTAIKTAIENVWNAIKTTIANTVKSISSNVSNAWNSIKSAASTAWNNIKTAIGNAIEGARSTVSSKVSAIKSLITGCKPSFPKLQAPNVGDILETVRNKVAAIKSAISNVHLAFPKVTLPNIPMPHFHVSGGVPPYGIGGKGSMPQFSVSWYKKGGIFDTATLIGIGEAGKEAALPLNRKTYGEIAKGIAREGAEGGVVVTGNTFVVRKESDIKAIAAEINRQAMRERWATA